MKTLTDVMWWFFTAHPVGILMVIGFVFNIVLIGVTLIMADPNGKTNSNP